MMQKKTKGRQKIEMTKILDEKNLAVTFSKRYNGLFNKANELCTLCGVQLAIIILSPTKKPITFAEPSFDVIINRYMNQAHPSNLNISQLMEAYHNANKQELNKQLTDMMAQVEAQKKTGEKLDVIKKGMQKHGNWWDVPIPSLDLAQLEKLEVATLELKKRSEERIEGLMVEAAGTMTSFGSTRVDGAGPSM